MCAVNIINKTTDSPTLLTTPATVNVPQQKNQLSYKFWTMFQTKVALFWR